MKSAIVPMYLFRSSGPTLKISPTANGYLRLFVDTLGGDFFEDERDAVMAAFEKRSGFSEWDNSATQCPSDLTKWERI